MRRQRAKNENTDATESASVSGRLPVGVFFTRWLELFASAKRHSPHASVFGGAVQAERFYKGLLGAASTELFSQNFVEAFFRSASIDTAPSDAAYAPGELGALPHLRDGVRCAAMALVFGEDPHRWLLHAAHGLPGWTAPVVEDCTKQAAQHLLNWFRLNQAARPYPEHWSAPDLAEADGPRSIWMRLATEAVVGSPLARELTAPGNLLSAFVPYLSVAAPDIMTVEFLVDFFRFPATYVRGDFSPLEARRAAAMAIVLGEDPYEWLRQICSSTRFWTPEAIQNLVKGTYAEMRPWLKVAGESAPLGISQSKALTRMLGIERAMRSVGLTHLEPGAARIIIITRGPFYEDSTWGNVSQYRSAIENAKRLTALGVDHVFIALEGDKERTPEARLEAVWEQVKFRPERFHLLPVSRKREGKIAAWLVDHGTRLHDRLLLLDGRGLPSSIAWPRNSFEVLASFRTPHPFGDNETTAFRLLPDSETVAIQGIVDELLSASTPSPQVSRVSRAARREAP